MEHLDKVLSEVREERVGQVEREGWTPQHDDAHHREELASAAVAYTLNYLEDSDARMWWPADWDPEGFKPASAPINRRRDLIKAIALLVAEVERLDRNTPLPASVALQPRKA